MIENIKRWLREELFASLAQYFFYFLGNPAVKSSDEALGTVIGAIIGFAIGGIILLAIGIHRLNE